MKSLLGLLAAVLLASCTEAAVLRTTDSFISPTVITDWGPMSFNAGEDGPVEYLGLTIESLFNLPRNNEIHGGISVSSAAGFMDLGASGGSVLRANIEKTDWVFRFPHTVLRGGFYLREPGMFDVTAFDAHGRAIESTVVSLGSPVRNDPMASVVTFIGFEIAGGFNSLRVKEQPRSWGMPYVTDFDDVQWQVIPEPTTAFCSLLGMFLLLVPKQRYCRYSVS